MLSMAKSRLVGVIALGLTVGAVPLLVPSSGAGQPPVAEQAPEGDGTLVWLYCDDVAAHNAQQVRVYALPAPPN